MAARSITLGLVVGSALAAAAALAAAPATSQPAWSRPAGAEYISTSTGVEHGVVLLWPRIIPASGAAALHAQAASLRSALRQLMDRALPGRSVDVRPEPQRACPAAGCRAIGLGALLVHESRGCAVVALIQPPGQTMQRLVPWAGDITLKATLIPFREPAESFVAINDFVPCDKLATELTAHSADVERVLAEYGRLH